MWSFSDLLRSSLEEQETGLCWSEGKLLTSCVMDVDPEDDTISDTVMCMWALFTILFLFDGIVMFC